jgi:hypothetical protein
MYGRFTTQGSAPFSIPAWSDIVSLAKGAALAFSGAAAIYLIEWAQTGELADWRIAASAAIAVGLNALRKFVTNTIEVV